MASNYLFIDKIEIKKEEILTKLKEIVSKLFKDVPFGITELMESGNQESSDLENQLKSNRA